MPEHSPLVIIKENLQELPVLRQGIITEDEFPVHGTHVFQGSLGIKDQLGYNTLVGLLLMGHPGRERLHHRDEMIGASRYISVGILLLLIFCPEINNGINQLRKLTDI